MTEYADRDAQSLEPHYSKHVGAMTAEGLHAKSDIAAELAFRDARIAELEGAARKVVESRAQVRWGVGTVPPHLSTAIAALESVLYEEVPGG